MQVAQLSVEPETEARRNVAFVDRTGGEEKEGGS